MVFVVHAWAEMIVNAVCGIAFFGDTGFVFPPLGIAFDHLSFSFHVV